LIIDPTDALGLAGAIEMLLADDMAKATLTRQGFAHARKFSWRKCAAETLDAYDRFL
jgi:glycosyltransferase involved in cell wall biosynthesis